MADRSVAPGELVHATAVLVGDRGVLITGASGSGKSALARALIDRALARGAYAALVSDDQCLLQQCAGRLLCIAPQILKGGLEVWGSGLHAIDCEPAAVIHLALEFVDSANAIRFGADELTQLQGVAIRHLRLPKREVEAACRAVEASLLQPQWNKIPK